ncbi:MAG: TRAP transporter substrate-binding protein DctP [Pseudorhodoplanes sp.]|nr:TRAP transporter substrate-binding protein DctP [Pseudorhodoplanes sp.]
MDRRFSRLLAAGAAAILMAGVQAASAAEVEWKYYTYFAPNDKPTQLHKAFAEDVAKATNGRLKITVFASGELPYKASDVLRAVATNQVEIGDVALGFVAGDVPELNAFSMPFACTSMEKFYDNAVPAMSGTVEKVMQAKFKTNPVMHWVMPPQQLWLAKPVANIDGLKNLKVRSWNREQAELMRLVGGSGVTITPAEVIPALQRGVVDGAFTAAVPALDWKFYEVTKFGYMMNLTLAHQVAAVNQAALDKLPTDLRATFLAKAREWAPKYRAEMIQADKDARKTLAEKGMTLRDATPEEVAKLREITKPIADEWVSKTGDVGKEMLASAIKACS